MRAKLAILLGIAIVLLGAVPGQSQYPGGGQGDGGFGGGRGGKGGRGRNFDPAMVQQWMEKMKGQTGGDATQAPAWTPGMGRGPGRGGPGGGQGNSLDDLVQRRFQRYDLNGDGYLNHDEMPENLRAELDKWDTDKNGLIDLNEFKAWAQASIQQRMMERNEDNKDSTDGGEERKPPVAYRRGNLPKELPAWFSEMDTDQDAQIGLYEWKVSGRSLDEFNKIDRNGDGFLTVDEVLRYEVAQGRGAQPGGGTGDGGFFASPGGGAPAMGLAPGAGFGPGKWGNTSGRPTMFTPGGNNGGRSGRWGGQGGQGGGGMQGFGGQGFGGQGKGNRKNRGGQDAG